MRLPVCWIDIIHGRVACVVFELGASEIRWGFNDDLFIVANGYEVVVPSSVLYPLVLAEQGGIIDACLKHRVEHMMELR